MDLDFVKKSIISILNLNPKGISKLKINQEFKSHVGGNIPFGQFGYENLHSFLEHELEDNIRFEHKDMLYPVGTKNSGHILKLVKEKGDRYRHANGQQSQSGRQQSQQIPARAAVQEPSQTPNASPTMPPLIRYRPVVEQITGDNSASNNNVFCSTQLRDRLVQSQKAYIARRELLRRLQQKYDAVSSQSKSATHSEDRQNQQLNNSRHSQSNASSSNYHHQPRANQSSKQSDQPEMHARLKAMVLQALNKPQPTPSTSKCHEPGASNDFDDLWEDELENAKPPTINRSNPSSFYGVSVPSTGSTSPKSSSDPIRLETSSDDEEKLIEIPDLLSDFQPGDILPARVSDTNNPLKFWIHIRQEKYITQINELHEKMQKFYAKNKNSEELKIKHVDETENGYFAVEFSGQWHRVESYDSPMGAAVRCSFIDFGSRETINFQKLRRLDKQFWKVPKAAVCCGLGNIKPIGTTFSTRSANDFIDIVEDEKVYAKILHIDLSKKKAMVELELHKNKLHVNDELVKMNHATHNPIRANA